MSEKKPSAAGKGDDERVSDFKSFWENFDQIDWKKKDKCCQNCGCEESKVKNKNYEK